MNDKFSFARTWQLIADTLRTNLHRGLLTFAAVIGIVLILAMLYAYNAYPTSDLFRTYDYDYLSDMMMVLFFFGFFAIGIVTASRTFSFTGDKKRYIQQVMLPASTVEKSVAAIFITAVVVPVAYVAAFTIADALRVLLVHIFYSEEPSKLMFLSKMTDSFSTFMRETTVMVALFLAVQSVYILGSAYFRKWTLVKTTVAGMVLQSAFIFFCILLDRTILDHSTYLTYDSSISELVLDDEWVAALTATAILLAASFINYSLATWRMKENELANKW